MTITLLVLALASLGVATTLLVRLLRLERQIDAIHVDLQVALKDRLDVSQFLREQMTERVQEWKNGGGRSKLRDRLRERNAER